MLRFRLLILLLFGLHTAGAQLCPYVFAPQRAYPLMYHFTYGGLVSLLAEKEYSKEWDGAKGAYKSYIPTFLQIGSLAGQTLSVEVTGTDNIGYHFSEMYYTLPEVNGNWLDSIFARERVIERLTLKYDAAGRLQQRTLYNTEHKAYHEWDTTLIDYAKRADTLLIGINYSMRSLSEKAGYTGDFKTGPVRSASFSRLLYSFNARGQLCSFTSLYQKQTDNKKGYEVVGDYFCSYAWNNRGLLVQKRDSGTGTAGAKVHGFTYKESAFDINTAQQQFVLLKTPAIKRWLKKSFKPGSLSLLHLTGASAYDATPDGVYLVHNKRLPVMRLENPEPLYGQMDSRLYVDIDDSTGHYKYMYYITKLPDVNDSVPYSRPRNYSRSHDPYRGVVESFNPRPGSLIDAHSADMGGTRQHVFKSKWRVFYIYRTQTTSISFSPGFAPGFFAEPALTDMLFIDPQGRIRFCYQNERFYRVVY